ncbi:unnamed protein product [Urochloa decumbens]|uniref:Uncharacterized protein n=3 Tax=Urochloa decumbens TaxID=240449 RepID=A0ABC8WED3_9POAL
MASTQMTAEDMLDQSIEQAKSSLQSQELLNQAKDVVIANERIVKPSTWPPLPGVLPQITLLGGVLMNKTNGALSVMDEHKYEGHVVSIYPNPLQIAGTFAIAALTNKGIKAAVVYSGKNEYNVKCGWLLAFADTHGSVGPKPLGLSGRKIYAECGPKEKFNKIDWAHVERKLNSAGTVAKAYDVATGTSLYARIVDSHDGTSAVGAVFHG